MDLAERVKELEAQVATLLDEFLQLRAMQYELQYKRSQTAAQYVAPMVAGQFTAIASSNVKPVIEKVKLSLKEGDGIIYEKDGMAHIGRVTNPAVLGSVNILDGGKSKWIAEKSVIRSVSCAPRKSEGKIIQLSNETKG